MRDEMSQHEIRVTIVEETSVSTKRVSMKYVSMKSYPQNATLQDELRRNDRDPCGDGAMRLQVD